MKRLLPLLLICPALLAAQVLTGNEPFRAAPHPKPALPVGKWKVDFANGVTEVCEIRSGGEAHVNDTVRLATGRAVAVSGSVVITFADDRVERWTPVGRRYVVEHWFPGSRIPTVPAVLGIAERSR